MCRTVGARPFEKEYQIKTAVEDKKRTIWCITHELPKYILHGKYARTPHPKRYVSVADDYISYALSSGIRLNRTVRTLGISLDLYHLKWLVESAT